MLIYIHIKTSSSLPVGSLFDTGMFKLTSSKKMQIPLPTKSLRFQVESHLLLLELVVVKVICVLRDILYRSKEINSSNLKLRLLHGRKIKTFILSYIIWIIQRTGNRIRSIQLRLFVVKRDDLSQTSEEKYTWRSVGRRILSALRLLNEENKQNLRLSQGMILFFLTSIYHGGYCLVYHIRGYRDP